MDYFFVLIPNVDSGLLKIRNAQEWPIHGVLNGGERSVWRYARMHQMRPGAWLPAQYDGQGHITQDSKAWRLDFKRIEPTR